MVKLSKVGVQKWAEVAFASKADISRSGSDWTIKCVVKSPSNPKVKVEIHGTGKTLDKAKEKCEMHFVQQLSQIIDGDEKRRAAETVAGAVQ